LIEIGSKTAEKNCTNRQTNQQILRKLWSLGREAIKQHDLPYCADVWQTILCCDFILIVIF